MSVVDDHMGIIIYHDNHCIERINLEKLVAEFSKEYFVKTILGKGNFGTVYRVKFEEDAFAVKVTVGYDGQIGALNEAKQMHDL